MSIQPLPPDVIAQIKSSIAITSLNNVVCELTKNSLDSGCTKLDILVDYARGGCVLEDNGLGILPSEFREDGGLGKLHYSSKLRSKTSVHGKRGAFLASLSAVALLTITSHHYQHHSHNSIAMHKSEIVSRQTPARNSQHISGIDHGTRVTVRDLFGNMPVRVKQRAITTESYRGNSKDWEELKRNIALLLLSWPRGVAVTIREAETVQKIVIRLPSSTRYSTANNVSEVDISKVCSILSQASIIVPQQISSWVQIRASTEKLEVAGTISLDPSATKNVQFISFGIQPLVAVERQTVIHDEINRLFLNSAFGNEEEAGSLDDAERARRVNDARYLSNGYANRELKAKKGVEKWPMYYINIHQKFLPECRTELSMDEVLDDKGSNLGTILELLQATILEFLTGHHFRPKNRRKAHFVQDIKEFNTEFEHITDRSVDDHGKDAGYAGILRPASAPNLYSNVGNRRAKGVSSKKPKSKGDLCGMDIKIPSVRRSTSQLDSPFDQWSKVKRGNSASRTEIYKENGGATSNSSVPGIVPKESARLEALKSQGQPHNRTQLLSSNGKLIRRPFEEAEIANSRPPSVASDSDKKTNKSVSDGEDEIIEWTNPSTKLELLVNKRTGHTISANAAKTKSGRGQMSFFPQGPAFSRTNLKRNDNPKTDGPSPWIENLLKAWDNPIFAPAELSIPQVSIEDFDKATRDIIHGHQHVCTQIDIDRAFKESSRISSRISKDTLRTAKVISQVDNKFILVKLDAIDGLTDIQQNRKEDRTMLVIIDQHAADERIRIEALMEEFCSPNIGGTHSNIHTSYLDKPVIFEISTQEVELLRSYRHHFSRWGILYTISEDGMLSNQKVKEQEKPKGTQKVSIQSLPPGIAERCKSDPRLLISLLRTEVWKCAENPPPPISPSKSTDSWFHRMHGCPQSLLDMLNSRACRSAIMFNDELTLGQCEVLVERLSRCRFPFQCAHGRPSLVPLVDFGTLVLKSNIKGHITGSGSFGAAFRGWKDELNSGENKRKAL